MTGLVSPFSLPALRPAPAPGLGSLWVPALVALMSVGAFGLVGLAVVLADVLKLSACPLCVFQRVVYIGLGVVYAVAAVASGGVRRGLLWLGVAVALLGLGVALDQSYLQHFPDPALECSYTDPNALERLVDWLGMQWPRLFMATGFCSSKEWVMWGLSMADWSAVAFAGFTAVSAGLAWRRP